VMQTNRILYVQYTDPAAYPPLEHSSRMLADAGWQVRFLGITITGTETLRFPIHPNIQVTRLPNCNPGLLQKVHFVVFCLWALAWTLVWRPRWIYASDPFSCPIATLLSLVPGVGVIYHEHDSPESTDGRLPASATVGVMKLIMLARRLLVRRAVFCVLPNPERARLFANRLGATDVVCSFNCPDMNEIRSIVKCRSDETISLLYHGSVVPARLPKTVIEALSMAPANVKLTVIGYETIGSRGYVSELRHTAHQLAISDRVQFLGVLPTRCEVLEWCRRSDVGLAFMPLAPNGVNERHMTGASNKAFDCLACGMALLVSDLPDWRTMFVDPGYALACNPSDAKSIATALRWCVEHPQEVRAMGEAGRRRTLTEWNYQAQFAPVLERMIAPGYWGTNRAGEHATAR
jgi:glycosyltransferase involved in cell wall biosynthesis